ncbi:MAG: 1-(5-phosphoribosyl)-5-[(5-phosphoribosylamino)methylideneamino]imidazole-4-carboxamide isomerase [candidate division NC10 bacterium]|nr:1-(5-phosphoribosyl)-5-[(5-phosphoribosylamino)methylideneamino]imidazole-4-carboxamide isomerase [candidate division NC10 bacterium]
MLIIPAIDLKSGKVVRLTQGDPGRQTIYADDPVAVALRWQEAGAKRLHIVDLDGAFEGTPRQSGIIKRIAEAVDLPIQVGGGLRTLAAIDALLTDRVSFAILGTSAILDQRFLEEACTRYPGRIILAVDAKEGKVAVKGWMETTETSALELIETVATFPLAAIIYTDISKDGTQDGPNPEALRKVAEISRHPVIASGGISSLNDVRRVAAIRGMVGMLVGKALYAGALDFKEATEVAVQTARERHACETDHPLP